MKDFFRKLLVDPVSGEPLIYEEYGNILRNDTGERSYNIINGVPVLLPQKLSLPVTSPLHKNLKSTFNYVVHYQKDAEVYDYFGYEENHAMRNEIHRLHEAIINAVPVSAQLILDVGCGNGWLAKHFIPRTKKVISMDISAINPTRVLQQNPGDNHAAFVADIFHLPIKNNSIDCIVAAEVMEHVYDPELFINSLVEKIKPGGKIIITTPYDEKIEYYLCVHCNLPTPKNAHLHCFNKQNIKSFIKNKHIKWRAKSFMNKYLIKLRLYVLLRFLPYHAWKFIDKAANVLVGKQSRFLIEIIKT